MPFAHSKVLHNTADFLALRRSRCEGSGNLLAYSIPHRLSVSPWLCCPAGNSGLILYPFCEENSSLLQPAEKKRFEALAFHFYLVIPWHRLDLFTNHYPLLITTPPGL